MCESVPPGKLHEYWPFLRRGLETIIKKTKHIRWIPEDVYASLSNSAAVAFLVRQDGKRVLGFFIVHPQNIGFSDRTELFLWAGWTLPLREREPGDDVEGGLSFATDYMIKLAHDAGHVAVSYLTARRGFRIKPLHYFKEAFTAYRVDINPQSQEATMRRT
jgi:hypothetical protein